MISQHPFKILATICLLLSGINAFADAPLLKKKELPRLSYNRYGLFYETGTLKYPNGESKISAPGFEMLLSPPYDDGEENVTLGWTVDLVLGYNMKSGKVRPYIFDIGFWGRSRIGDKMEWGLQYCFLGVYGYQGGDQFGSSISPAFRYKRIQAKFTRAGEGAVRGCFVPRFPKEFTAQHSFELSYITPFGIAVGTKYTRYRFGLTEAREIRIFAAISMD
jgi:hypothetical protein